MNKFKQLGLSDKILEVLEKIGFETPTPIQEKAIPMMLENPESDFIGLAQTGTGKTAAFGLPLLELIDSSKKHTQALIMAPTRELGQQIGAQLVEFSQNNRKLSIEVVYGGSPIYRQIKALKAGVQIVVATPGRLLDLINRKAVQLSKVDFVVLDEADEMLNMGFQEDIDAILEHTGDKHAIWLYSATMPPAIRRIVKNYMVEPLEAVVNTKEKTNKDITHQFAVTKASQKLAALRRFLDMLPEMRGVMFCRTKRETEQIALELGRLGYDVAALNGDMSQMQREKTMKLFKSRAMQLLIATDVAARGIDVKDLTHVIHHSLPDQLEYYTHRSGRTGRAGNKGISLCFIGPRQRRKIKDIEKRIKVEFEEVQIPSHEEVLSSRINRWADRITQTEIHEQAEIVMWDLQGQFDGMNKEKLLKLLISAELNKLLQEDGESGDLNYNSSRKSDRKPKEKRKNSRPEKNENANRYFINLGMIDGVSQSDLVDFLTEMSGVSKKHIGGISLQKKCAYFDVDKQVDEGFGYKFKGIEVKGRPIRVNRDEGPTPKFAGRKGKKKGGKKGKRK